MSDDSDYQYSEEEQDEDMSSAEEDQWMDQGSEEAHSDGNDDDFGLDHHVAARKAPYKILKHSEIEKERGAAILSLTSMLCVSDEDATRVLRKFKWDVNRAQDAWFADEAAVRTSLGIAVPGDGPGPSNSHASNQGEEKCNVCWENFPVSQMRCTPCGHYLCRACWNGYVSTAISNGITVLDLRCPIPKCGVAVPKSLIQESVDKSDWDKYSQYELRSYVEDNRQLCWCIGKGCDAVVEALTDRVQDEPLDVTCTQCQCAFCFACKEEAHRPVSCEVVHKWIVKNSAESENVQWILANTKPCPNCLRPIEKNQGCMHMTCSQCKHQFCWLCQGDWKEHGDSTGGYFACNRYKKSANDEEVRKRETAKQSLERYLHYFERWDAHQKARNKARVDTQGSIAQFIETLSEQTKTPTSQLKFILTAWEQIIDCRRVLSWTYTFGYYTYDPNLPNAKERNKQKEFFEFLQGEAESALERLHGLAEDKLRGLTQGTLGPGAAGGGAAGTSQGQAGTSNGNMSIEDKFQAFRTNLVGLTEVTRNYFVKLVRQLEKGFDNLANDYAGQVGGAGPSGLLTGSE